MNYLKDKIAEMLEEEQGASDEYLELANEVFDFGLPKSEAIKIYNIARDERRHFDILKSILKKIS